MRIPTIAGVIRRRMLVNFRVDPEVMQRQLPARFTPKLHNGYAVAGVCLIRLEHIRPRSLPAIAGLNSENAAHRVAVLWKDEESGPQEGVFIPRRDTDSLMNHLAGGRIFPGEHKRATFKVKQSPSEIDFDMKSEDGEVAVRVVGSIVDELPATSIFSSLPEASTFFEGGSLGYSVTSDSKRLDGLRLETKQWRVEALAVREVISSYFGSEILVSRRQCSVRPCSDHEGHRA